MSNRLSWARGDGPQRYIATMPEGIAEIWFGHNGHGGTEGWNAKVTCGETRDTDFASSKQDAANRATEMWPGVVRREEVRRQKADEARRLEAQIDAAYAAGRVSVLDFELGTSSYDRLLQLNAMLVRKKMLAGPLAPLAKAVSAELYRRRVG